MTIIEIREQLAELEKLPQAPERWECLHKLQDEALKTPEYKAYEKAIVEEGVKRMGEDWRKFWETMSFEDGFCEDLTVEEEVDGQIDAMRDSAEELTP